MNNQQFRRLILENSSAAQSGTTSSTPRKDVSTPTSLGSRMRSSIPMTPRTVAGSAGIDFARQLREQQAGPAASKKFRSSAAPKGTRLAAGYQDRTQKRTDVEEDDKATRVKALEDLVKLGQMEYATFEKLRDEIVGGDVRDAHLVRGLDWKLLERARRGEVSAADVAKDREDAKKESVEPVAEEKEEEGGVVDVDEAFDEMEEKEVVPIAKEAREKKGEMAPPPPVAGRKRTRDDILRELKGSRAKAAEEEKAAQPSLGPKFRKLGGQNQPSSRIERDEKGREVLITVDEDGNVKRKVRKAKPGPDATKKDNGLLMPDKDIAPLGMEAPAPKIPEPVEEDDDMDIFEGVGADYDPLAGEEADEDDSDDESDTSSAPKPDATAKSKASEPVLASKPGTDSTSPAPSTDMPPPPLPQAQTKAPPSRNYFNDTSSSTSIDTIPTDSPLSNPSLLAALKKASVISGSQSSLAQSADAPNAEKLARRAAMLAADDRDAQDMDLGFGSSRFDDQEEGEEGEGTRVKLSRWTGTGADREGGGEGGKGAGGGAKRKRGGKKRKGDGNSAADVLAVLERRQEKEKAKS